MLFYSDIKANECVFCDGKILEFVDGKYESKEKKEIDLLLKSGYKNDGKVEATQEDLSEVKFDELRKMASEKGIKGYGKMKREELIEALGGE